MVKKPAQRIAIAALCLLALALVAIGAYGLSLLGGARGEELLSAMRTRAMLAATGENAVESFVEAAKKAAVEQARAAGASMAEVRAASAAAEEEARANTSTSLIDYNAVDAGPLSEALLALRAAQADYTAEETRAQLAYAEQQAARATPEPPPIQEAPEDMAPAAAAEGVIDGMGDMGMAELDDFSLEEEEPVIDLTGFQATAEMVRLQGVVDAAFQTLAETLRGIYPTMDDAAIAPLKPMILSLTHQSRDNFATEFDRCAKAGGLNALIGGDATQARVIRYGDDMLTIGVALVIVSLMLLFYGVIVRSVGVPLLIIGSFFILLCVMSGILDLSIPSLLSSAIVRMGMNSVMVLAMLPAIQCGIRLNLGLPVGIIGGLLGGLLCIEFGFSGWWGLLFAIVVGLIISAPLGYLYSLLLNRLKGNEMAVTTYVGFSVVSLMCIGWLVFPFNSLVLKWPLGTGLRATISLEGAFYRILDRFLAFKIGGVTIPTGLLLFMALSCFAMWLFMRTKTGIAMSAAGNNPRFAEATGISVDKMRIIGTTLSTMLGAVGIIVYSQSYGFMQLYTGPRTLGLVAASAILIGGATVSRARISNVIIGTFLFQGVLTLGMPVANALIPGSTIAETIRVLVSNGIILYALTKSGGDSRA